MENSTATALPDWLLTSATALESFLKSHADAEQQVREILDKHLNKIGANTWNNLFSSLDNYWEKETTNIFFDTAQQTDQAGRLEEISKSVPPEVTNFLRKIISLYGSELTNALIAVNQLPNNWKTFYRDVYYDYINKNYYIRVRLEKYNGEEPFIEGNADSILELTTFMIQTLLFLPKPEKPGDFFGQPVVEQFVTKANELIRFLQPPSPEESVVQPESKSTAPGKKRKSKTTK